MVADASRIAALEAAVDSFMSGGDSAHDLDHCRRVFKNALQIAEHHGQVNEKILTAAAYLHDIVNVPKNSADRHRASVLSAEAARPILLKLGYTQAETDAIAHVIEAHSYSAKIPPRTIEAKILQDADRLESLGALGVARTFYTAGKMSSLLFAADDPFARRRALDDRQYAVDHFFAKLLQLPASMQTEHGRELAEERCRLLRDFVDALADELHVDAGDRPSAAQMAIVAYQDVT